MDLQLEQKQQMYFSQSYLFEIHPVRLEAIIESILARPIDADHLIRKNMIISRSTGKRIVNFDYQYLEHIIDHDPSQEVKGDVNYIPMANSKPKIAYSPHLIPNIMVKQMQMPEYCVHAKKLYKILDNQHKWLTKKLREMYRLLGDNQREFIATEDISKLLPYQARHVAIDMNLNHTTIIRIRKNRFFQINGGKLYNSDLLMPIKDEVERYQRFPKMNVIFKVESYERKAVSDITFEKLLGIPRRTVTKYRHLNDIPDKSDRQRVYDEQPGYLYQLKP